MESAYFMRIQYFFGWVTIFMSSRIYNFMAHVNEFNLMAMSSAFCLWAQYISWNEGKGCHRLDRFHLFLSMQRVEIWNQLRSFPKIWWHRLHHCNGYFIPRINAMIMKKVSYFPSTLFFLSFFFPPSLLSALSYKSIAWET